MLDIGPMVRIGRVASTTATALTWLACVICTLVPGVASAQMGMGMQMDGMQGITRRGVDAYARILGLDEEQKQTAMTLLEGNQQAVREAGKAMQARMAGLQEKAQESGDFTIFQKEMPAISKEFSGTMESLEKGFFDDLKATLTDEQLGRWETVERYRRREQGMRFGFVAGAAVDLIAAVDRSKAGPEGSAEFTETLSQYELEVDRGLRVLEKAAKEGQEKVFEGGMFDMTKIEEMMKGFSETGRTIRDTNRQYATRLSALMRDDARGRFEAEIKRRTFPRVYKQGHTEKLFDAAAGFADLDAGQKEAIADLRSQFARDLAGANERWAEAIEVREEKAGGAMMVMMKQAMMQGGSDEVTKAREARKELDEKAADRLKAILTDGQRARLPEAKIEAANPFMDAMNMDPEAFEPEQ